MNIPRIEQLKKFSEADPNDPFPIYALGLEYLKGDKNEAKKQFELLLEKHPEYTATYYHAAQLWIELELLEEVKPLFEKGIFYAEKNKDSLALRELRNAYQNYLFEYEDEEEE